MSEKSCKDCAYCNMRQFNRGRWYCNNPEVSVFAQVPYELPCFKPRKGKRKPEGEEDSNA